MADLDERLPWDDGTVKEKPRVPRDGKHLSWHKKGWHGRCVRCALPLHCSRGRVEPLHIPPPRHRALPSPTACVLKRHRWPEEPRRTMGRGGVCAHRNSAMFINRPEPSTQAVPGEYEALQTGIYIASGHPIAVAPARTHVHTHATSVTQPMIGVNRYAPASVYEQVARKLGGREDRSYGCPRLRTQATMARVQHVSVQDGAHGRRAGHL